MAARCRMQKQSGLGDLERTVRQFSSFVTRVIARTSQSAAGDLLIPGNFGVGCFIKLSCLKDCFDDKKSRSFCTSSFEFQRFIF